MVLAMTVSCGGLYGKGAIIPMYLASVQSNMDPAATMYDKDTIQYISLLYEGLVTIAKDGSVNKGMAKKWYTQKEEDEFCVYFELQKTRWNDKTPVVADDFVYAWQRILAPESNIPAAALLYDIKNAKKIKSGELTVADLGVTAVEDSLLRIVLEKEIELSLLLENLASPALGPLRDDIVEASPLWSSSSSAIATNGAFSLKRLTYKGDEKEEVKERNPDRVITEIWLERNSYYHGDVDESNLDKYVIPHRLITDYSLSAKDAMAKFESGELFYIGSFTKETYTAHQKELVTQPLLSTGTLYFDCSNTLFADAAVRTALGNALDRQAIADLVGMGAKAATGFVSDGVFDDKLSSKSSFRTVGGTLYTYDAAGAKSALKGKSGSFAITYRNANASHKAVADYVTKAWSALGFTVKAEGLSNQEYEAALLAGTFDVLMLDYQGLSSSAYSFLAPFAKYYSGSVVDVRGELYTPHITGYQSDAYDRAIDAVFAATTRKDRAAKLHDAEKILCQDNPAIALYFNYDAYLASDRLDDLASDVFGNRIFNNASLDNYEEVNDAIGG